jgi:hypothetical protein
MLLARSATSTRTSASTPTSQPDPAADKPTDDGFERHRCTCRHATVLGSHGFDSKGRYVYKFMVRDRIVLIYFGAFTVRCRDCKRWCRVRMLPKERKVDISVMKAGEPS